ncbi:hypothetical protein PSTG_00465 [Puccinia striiformis f. sp. tritici PST-78]|uniref:Peroxin/Ferlin domain-containing protein n=1 Tax=Puccinia striiformis f. sp. tritici PST-78 TaxID=1165861 RepID=A0A0L0W504_9BASI|nr:hypothetical protein PSTG_00465 [Puccinia striiformis f. sp. tritici PST-78]
MDDEQSLIDLVFSLPPALLKLLTNCSGPITLIAGLIQTISWTHPKGPWPSWILLFSYLLFCQLSAYLLSYGLINIFFLILVISLSTATNKTTTITHPIAVLHSLQDFQIIIDHYSALSTPIYQILFDHQHQPQPQQSTEAIRACLTTLPLTILIGRFIPTQTIFIFIGTLLLTWSSPWFILLRKLVNRSLIVKFISTVLVDLLFHLRFIPLQRYNQFFPEYHQESLTLSSSFKLICNFFFRSKHYYSNVDSHGKSTSLHTNSSPRLNNSGEEIEFSLTIYENQRWWMGLDWTPNLLPHERTNWTDSLNQPVPSPGMFQLPSMITYKDIREDRLKRRVEWSWIDPEWKIIDSNHQQNNHQVWSPRHPTRNQNTSENSPPPPTHDSPNVASPPESPHLHQRTHNRSVSQSGSIGGNFHSDSEILSQSLLQSGLGLGVVNAPSNGQHITGEWEVDPNGWQYGDNHWEKMSKKSGIGRYTRRRAWTRKALMRSIIIPIEIGSPSSNDSTSSSNDNHQNQEEEERNPTILKSPAPSSSSSSAARIPGHPITPASPVLVTTTTSSASHSHSHSSSHSSSSSSTALSLNLKRSLGLLRRK